MLAPPLLALTLAGTAQAVAPGQPSLCRPPGAGTEPPPAPEVTGRATGIFAEEAELRQSGASDIVGRVVLRRGDQTVAADTVTYYRESERVEALDGIRFWDSGLYAQAAQGQVDLGSENAWLENVHYRFLTSAGRGDARSAALTGSGIAVIEDGTFTTCDPGSDDWVIQAREITLDRPEDLGVARDATLRFQGLPILYTPYLDFPLSGRRKSGLLPPVVGSTSNRGFELTLPYYWNIAPERDATLRVGELTKRGPMLGGEYRYLMPTGRGNLQFEVLPHDQEDGDTRGLGRFQHQQTFAGNWWTHVDAAAVSDERYVEDLGTNLNLTSKQYLEQRADLGTSGSGWFAFGRLQHFTTVDPQLPRVSRPYARLPQLLAYAGTPERYEGAAVGVQTELVRFAQPDRVEGDRADLYPTLSYPIRTPATFVVPKIGARYTTYQLNDTDPGTAADPRPIGSA
ncbi:MAG: LPS assembly protein LptD, partial [Gammaproteobacteria bacterium]|nr:LPS assembly protein LptD [Gammaproteobacteria bacterium]